MPLIARILRTIAPFAVALGIAFTIQATTARLYEVRQESMAETLADGDIVLGEKLTPRFGTLAHGDIVVFEIANGPVPDAALIKRVIGLPGDEIRIAEGIVFRNGEPLLEAYVTSNTGTQPLNGQSAFLVPAGEYFLLGDHRDASIDSRAFGPVALADIEARVIFRLLPFDGFGAP